MAVSSCQSSSSNIADEHNAVRQHCGVFDVSHMGEVTVKGPDAERYVNHIFTNDVRGAEPGKIFYGMMCYENGGTVDDLLVYKMADNDFFLVINAANIDKDVEWMESHLEGYDVEFKNCSEQYGQLAVQGPEAEQVVEEVLGTGMQGANILHNQDYRRSWRDNHHQPHGLHRRRRIRNIRFTRLHQRAMGQAAGIRPLQALRTWMPRHIAL